MVRRAENAAYSAKPSAVAYLFVEPIRLTSGLLLKLRPVVAGRRKAFDKDRAVRARVAFMRDIGRKMPRGTWFQLARFTAGDPRYGAFNADANLLSLVMMLGDSTIWLKVENAQREVLALYPPPSCHPRSAG